MSERMSVVEEQLDVGTRTVETGRVRISRQVDEHVEIVDVPLREEQVEVRRVPVDRMVDAPAATRQEGDTTIIPVHEEVLVVTRTWRLVEEWHVSVRRSEVHAPREVVLRRESVQVDRTSSDGPADGSPGENGDLPGRES